MKKLSFIFIAAVSVLLIHAQNSTATQQQVDSAVQKISAEQYVRIPQKDFDTIIQNKIDEAVRSKVFFWISTLAAVITAGLGLINNFLLNKQKQEIEKNANQILGKLQGELQQTLRSDFEKYAGSVDDKFVGLNKILAALWTETAYNIIDRTKNNNNFIDAVEAQTFDLLLENKTFPLPKQAEARLIDAYMKCLYYSYSTFGNDAYPKMIELKNTFEKNIQLLPETYAMAAIAFQDKYERDYLSDDRASCLECCEESIKKLPDYGTPYALKLETYMIDYLKGFDANDQNTAQQNVLRTLKAIENVTSDRLINQVSERLKTDRSRYLKRYIDALETQFKAETDRLNIQF